jgi:hypothetical protein
MRDGFVEGLKSIQWLQERDSILMTLYPFFEIAQTRSRFLLELLHWVLGLPSDRSPFLWQTSVLF